MSLLLGFWMDFFWDLPGWVKPRSARLQGSFLGALPALSSHDLSYLIHGELPKDRPASTLPPAPSKVPNTVIPRLVFERRHDLLHYLEMKIVNIKRGKKKRQEIVSEFN